MKSREIEVHRALGCHEWSGTFRVQYIDFRVCHICRKVEWLSLYKGWFEEYEGRLVDLAHTEYQGIENKKRAIQE